MSKTETNHWWYASLRKRVVEHLKREGLPANASLLDVGCGTGGTLVHLRAAFPDLKYFGLDPDEKALSYTARYQPHDVRKGTANILPYGDDTFDAVLCLDVLYYPDVFLDQAFLEFKRVLKRNGILLLNLPAFSVAAGAHDAAVGIPRRFQKKDIHPSLQKNEFRLITSTYWNTLLFLPLLAWRWMSRLVRVGALRSDVAKSSGVFNAFFGPVMAIEERMGQLISLPFGSSLYIVARKNG